SGTREAKSDGKLGKTQKTDCPKFNGNFYKKRGLFQIKIINPQHNHPPSEDSSTHSSALMQNSSAPTSVTLNTIYNARNAMQTTELEGKSPMEALTSNYVLKNIIPLKEKIVAYCINKHPHFGNTVTSRVEGAHAYLKRFIHTSTGSFYAVVKQIHQALNNQLHERFIESSQHSYKHLTGLPPCLANLSGPITHYAIKTVHALFLLDPPTSTCSDLYSCHMGMPCIHKIHQAKSEGLKLSPEDFHPQWHTNLSSRGIPPAT
ncbi:hypothetical protein MJO28_016869, partial [Puccinia striiformis f. sp. tritici]